MNPSEIKVRQNLDIAEMVFDKLDIRPDTRKDYKYRIKHYVTFTSDKQFSTDTLLRYKDALREDQTLSVATKNKYLTAARIFLREVQKYSKQTRPFNTDVKNFQQSKKHKVFGLDDYDVARVSQWMNTHPEKRRERAILSLLLFQGLRQAEVCALNFYEVDLEEGVLLVRGKGMDDKEPMSLHPQTTRELSAYMEERKAEMLPSDVMLFVSKRAKTLRGELTARGLRGIVKCVFAEAGVDRTVHGTRHYFTTHLIKSMDGSLLQVARFTRHKSIETLQIYNDALLEEEDVKRYQNAFNDVAAGIA